MRNAIAAHQSPKPRCGNDRDEEARPGNCYTRNPRYNYEPYDTNKPELIKDRFDGSGEANEIVDWKCDCGYIRAPQSSDWECCPRCGSTLEPEYR